MVHVTMGDPGVPLTGDLCSEGAWDTFESRSRFCREETGAKESCFEKQLCYDLRSCSSS